MGGLRNKNSTEIVRESGFETESVSDPSEDETDSESDVSESEEDSTDESTTDLIIRLMWAYYCIDNLMLERSELLDQLQRYTMPNLESEANKRFVAKQLYFPKIHDKCCQTENAVFLEPCIHQGKHVQHVHPDKQDDDLVIKMAKIKEQEESLEKREIHLQTTIKKLEDKVKRSNDLQLQIEELNVRLQTTMQERDNLNRRCTDLESKTHDALFKNATGNLQQVPDETNKFDEQHTLVTELLEENKKQSETINRMQKELESAKTRESQVVELQRKCKQTQNELDVVKSRLSKLMGQKLTDNNPNITDLSDRNRPTKLAERFTELYDNQWTDAFDILDQGNEQETIELLHGMLMDIFQFCKLHSEKQILEMKTAIVQGDHEELPIEVVKQLKDCRKVAAVVTGKQLFESYRQTVLSTEKYSKVALKVEDYLKECFAICWMMCVQDPPVVFSQEMRPGDPFNTDIYKAYTATGNSVAFTVWPGLMLHENGPLLCKGVAQGFNK